MLRKWENGKMNPTKMYRYEDRRVSRGVDEFDDPYPGFDSHIYLHDYDVTKVTDKGVWIRAFCEEKGKFVLLSGKKRYAHPTEEEALTAFIYRKKSQLGYLRGNVQHVESVIRQAEHKQGGKDGLQKNSKSI